MDASGFDVDGGRASTVGRQDQRAPRDKLGYVSLLIQLKSPRLPLQPAETMPTIPRGATRNLHLARSHRDSAILLDPHRLDPLLRTALSHRPSRHKNSTFRLPSSTTLRHIFSRLASASTRRRAKTSSLPSTTQRSRSSRMSTRMDEAPSLPHHAESPPCHRASAVRRPVSVAVSFVDSQG